MGILVGATSAQVKAAGLKLDKGRVYKLSDLSSKARAAISKAGTVKPTIAGTVSLASIPSPASGIIKASAAADKVLPKDTLVNTMLSKIPDVPGTTIDNKIKDFIGEHPIVSAAAVGVVATAAAAGIVYAATKKKNKTTSKKKAAKRTTKRKAAKKKAKPRTSKRRTRKSGYGSEAAYNRKGGKKVYKTKNGQPYILLASGKARFIKKSR